MRISRSPQNGGFQRWTGGGPLRAASRAAPARVSKPSRVRSVSRAIALLMEKIGVALSGFAPIGIPALPSPWFDGNLGGRPDVPPAIVIAGKFSRCGKEPRFDRKS